MSGRIKGITVKLYERTQDGKDEANRPKYKETATTVDNVLVAPTSATEILDATNIHGKKAVYTLAIPKGDTHEWRDCKVEFFGQSFRVFGEPLEGMEHQIPLDWNKKVTVERYE
jgi:hypothetical protein